jgi:hypothetical protein
MVRYTSRFLYFDGSFLFENRVFWRSPLIPYQQNIKYMRLTARISIFALSTTFAFYEIYLCFDKLKCCLLNNDKVKGGLQTVKGVQKAKEFFECMQRLYCGCDVGG